MVSCSFALRSIFLVRFSTCCFNDKHTSVGTITWSLPDFLATMMTIIHCSRGVFVSTSIVLIMMSSLHVGPKWVSNIFTICCPITCLQNLFFLHFQKWSADVRSSFFTLDSVVSQLWNSSQSSLCLMIWFSNSPALVIASALAAFLLLDFGPLVPTDELSTMRPEWSSACTDANGLPERYTSFFKPLSPPYSLWRWCNTLFTA